MPYIITPGVQTTDAGTNFEAMAVETIERARSVVWDLARETNANTFRLREITYFPPNGGKIGPLPNGRVIDVELVSWLRLAALSGDRINGAMLRSCLNTSDFAPAIDAFNDQ